MTTTTHLDLPHLAAAQAQKHVTHNEALDLLDAIIHLSVASQLATPPGSPAEGDRHLVIATATGAWVGWEKSIAAYIAGGWVRVQPSTGWRCWDDAAEVLLVYTGAAWQTLASEAPIDGLAYARQDGAWVEVSVTGGLYDIALSFGGTPTASEILNQLSIPREVNLAADFAGSAGHVSVNPTGSFVISIQDDGVEIGTVTIGTGGVFSFASTGGTAKVIAAGSKLIFEAQASVDATIDTISFTLPGEV